MQRARSGDGSVFLDTTKNAWVGVIDLGRDENGRRRRRKVFAATRPEAKQKLRQLRAEFDAGTLAVPNSMTVGDLLGRWIDTVAPSKVAPTALATYRWAIDRHLVPGLGHHRLRALTPEHVDAFLDAKATAGLSKSSLIRFRAVLGQALRWAARRGYVARNAAALSDLPADAKPAKEGRALSPDEMRRFLAVATGHRLGAALCVMATLGLRPGEVSGLRWIDLDLEAGVVHVRQSLKHYDGQPVVGEPKTKRSRRTLTIPAVALVELKRHHLRSAEERLALGASWPAEWKDLAFVSDVGTPLDPSNLRRMVQLTAKDAELGHVSPYDLRHSACSLLCEAGVPLEHVADVLGHESTRMASQVYRHVVAPSITAAVAPMDRMLRAV